MGDLIWHTKMGNPQRNDPRPTYGQIRTSDDGHVHTVARANEHPEWLPDGWLVELKMRKSGASLGKQDKSYVDPSTGFRFYSKPQVLRYLNNVKQKCPISNQEKQLHSTSKVVTEKYVADDLPPGWIKEHKVRKSACGKKKDPYYTDPASGYVFRSKKDVFHYLETGEISRHAFLPKKRKLIDQKCTNDETTPLSAAKGHSLENRTENINNAKANNSGSSRKNKELDLPRRSSKRLAGLEPELAANEGALQNVTTKLSKIKANTVKLVEEAAQHLKIGHRMGSAYQATVDLITQSNGDLASSKVLPCEKAVPGLGEKLQMIETKKIHDDTSAVQTLLYSNPCMKNAMKKTLINAVPVKEAAYNGIVCAIPANILQEKNLGECSSSAVQPLFSSDPCLKNITKKKNLGESSTSAVQNATKKIPTDAVPVNEAADNVIICAIPANILREKNLGETSTSAVQPSFFEDPCLKNVTKTPTGAVPVKEAANNGIVCAIPANILQEKNLGETSTSAVQPLFSSDPCLKNVTKKNIIGESSTSAVQSLFSSDPCLKNATKKNPTGAVPVKEAADNGIVFAIPANILQEKNLSETSTSAVQPLFSLDPCQKNVTKKKNLSESSTSAVQPPFSLDPCLKNVTKTPTGTIPIKEADNGIVCAIPANILQEKNLGETSTSAVQPLFSSDPCLKNVTKKKSIGERSTSAVQPLFSSDPCLKNVTKKTPTGAVPVKKAADNGIVCAIPANILQEKNLGETSTSAVQPLFSLNPCLKNVTKRTLTGAVPVKGAADNGIVCAIPANILQMKSIGETSIRSSAGKKTSIKKKKECHLPLQSSKQFFGLAPRLVENSLSSEQDLGLATRDSCNKEATQDVGLASENLANGAGACQLVEAGPITGYRQECSNTTSVSREDSSKKSKKPVQDQTFPADKSQKLLVNKKMYSEKSELQFSLPFANSRANSSSDPCLEFAIKTLTGATSLEDAINNRLVSAPAANIQQENNIGENIIQRGSSVKTAMNSSKSKKLKKNKELNLPRRSSKRLAGLTPEQVVDSFSSKEALTTAARNSCNKEAIQVAGLTSGNLANGSCQEHYPGPRTGLGHDHTYTATAWHEELSTKSKELLQGQSQTAIAEQCHKLDDEDMPSEKSDPQIRFPFVDAWHDPCLIFAIKTLTGAIPLEEAAIDGLVSAPATNILQEKNLGEATRGTARRVETSLKSNKPKTKKKKELNLPRRSSKRLSRLATQPVVNSLSTEETFTVIGRNSCNEEAIRDAGLISEKLVDGACRGLETEPIMWLRHGSRYMAGALHEESSSKSKEKGNEPLQNQTVPTDHCQRPDSESIHDEKSKPQFLFPFRDSWSDPCIEFASKTHKGAIAVEDNFAVQDYFQQQLYKSSTKRDGDYGLPDLGLPNVFQTDISSHFDTPEKPPLGRQQVTMHLSGLPPANACLPSGSGNCSQQPCMRLRNYPAK